MKLRTWQSKCVRHAINHFRRVSKHFLCLATPGSGKTIMSSEVAARLIEQNLVDFVLCFSPSIAIAHSFKATFSKRLNHRFDGVIGAIGSSYTYQSMSYFDDKFWQILRTNRVLVVFDEIHHCSGSTVESANSWGEEIILNIQEQADYTLALTGTPWRSDKSPIVLSSYLKAGTIDCNYVYGLRQAVEEGVCRIPKIVLIDNEEISVTDSENNIRIFEGFTPLLNEKAASYQDIITAPKAIQYILDKGCKKLAELRTKTPNAGGLVVASSVKHALQIMQILQYNFNQSAVVVSYQQDAPSEIINSYRSNTTQWIVAIGMVSEGTDIPRLQVCCHLSKIKTELYFRQVLGRVLRVNGSADQHAWLYTFSEPSLVNYAYRIEEDLPETSVITKEKLSRDSSINNKNLNANGISFDSSTKAFEFDIDQNNCSYSIYSQEKSSISSNSQLLHSLEIL
ncbi:DEAD/DEAH box helicase [Aliikangiella sp. IMCC44359]|uniref:DEAD/DEAH box helicase n=1 Tax=Aliikangiella sp. IMCC44359 TaxID=3459125 RepID=UPI00403B1E39